MLNLSVSQLLSELQSFPAAGVTQKDIDNAFKKNDPPVPEYLTRDWMNGVYDEDPSYLTDELRTVTKNWEL